LNYYINTMKRRLLTVLGLGLFIFTHAQNDSDPDVSFNSSGIRILAPGPVHDNMKAVTMQPDQKIVACGVSMGEGGGFNFDAFVTRLNPDGSTDDTFATSGSYLHDFNGESDFLNDIEVLPNGKILVCGAASITAANTEVLLMQFNSDGTLDITFGSGSGYVITDIGDYEDYSNAMDVLDDGSIVVAGNTSDGLTISGLVMKFDSNGNPDLNFDSDGMLVLNTGNGSHDFHDVKVAPNGNIICAGDIYQTNGYKAWLSKLSGNGSAIMSFGTNGNYISAANNLRAFGLLLQEDRIVTCGNYSPFNQEVLLIGVTNDGDLDLTFGADGSTILDTDNLDVALGIKSQVDGKIVICGSSGTGIFTRDFLVARFSADGILDATFAGVGYRIYELGPDFEEANALTIQEDDRIVVVGFIAGTNNDMVVMRLYSQDLVSVSELVLSENVRIYPNPVTNFLTINSNKAVRQFYIYDNSGRICRQNRGSVSGRLDLSEMPSGLYNIQLLMEDGEWVTSRLIIE
jgi:uncharacterized delta-60 repeat protein